jgi:hypothetical protein
MHPATVFPPPVSKSILIPFLSPPYKQWDETVYPQLRASNDGLPVSYVSLGGSGQGCPLLRASDEHRFTVRVLRARRAPGRSLLILLRARDPRAQRAAGPYPITALP